MQADAPSKRQKVVLEADASARHRDKAGGASAAVSVRPSPLANGLMSRMAAEPAAVDSSRHDANLGPGSSAEQPAADHRNQQHQHVHAGGLSEALDFMGAKAQPAGVAVGHWDTTDDATLRDQERLLR